MKYIKSHNTMDMETGEFSMNIDGKTVNVINAQIVHCKNCNSIAVSDEVKDLSLIHISEPTRRS